MLAKKIKILARSIIKTESAKNATKKYDNCQTIIWDFNASSQRRKKLHDLKNNFEFF